LTVDTLGYQRLWYDAWGTRTSGGDPFNGADRARWKGALSFESDAGLYYMRNRWYEPRTGRFLTEDPIGLAGGINPFAFASGDPVNASDPTGLSEMCTLYARRALDRNQNGRADDGEYDPTNTFWVCSGGGFGFPDSPMGGGWHSADPSTECADLADKVGQIAARSRSVFDFTELVGSGLAGVSSISDLVNGGRNVLYGPTGGYRTDLGGSTNGQARHFAASVFAYGRYGPMFAAAGFAYNETMRAGQSMQDWRLSLVAFGLVHALETPDGPGGLRLRGGSVKQWILENVCGT
jgi:RHS repeat-associated protein